MVQNMFPNMFPGPLEPRCVYIMRPLRTSSGNKLAYPDVLAQ